ncbi:hypothetical protein AAFC00_001415 [Neodothiora populina]|uniref:Transcription factor TFIIIC complex subunit Tfc6 n=1 Tax=Neodothiora populina TaxID=2781224 RepID=A0ABR3PNV3_9PEZI
MAPQRKSARRKDSSKKYSVDPFDGLDLDDDLHEDSNAQNEDVRRHSRVAAYAPSDPAEDEFTPGEEDNLGDEVIENDYADADTLHGDSDPEEPRFHGPRRRKIPEYGKSKPTRAIADPRFQPRGLLEPATRGSKEVQRLFMFGPTLEDQGPPLQGHFKWSAEPTTPSRKATASGFGGFTRSYFLTPDIIKKEATEDWEWYDFDGGKEAFQSGQRSSKLPASEAEEYMPYNGLPAHTFVMGPYKQQKRFGIPVGTSIDLNEAWVPDASADHNTNNMQDPKSLRDGWIINLGQKVQSLDWAPNHEGSQQFLVVSTIPIVETRTGEVPYKTSSAPAFTAQAPFKSSFQVWEFASAADGRVSIQRPPRLRKVICTEFGNIKSMKWCPAPRKFDTASQELDLNVGLLAILFGDGSIRVIDVSVSRSTTETEYVHVQNTAFATRPPNTICTCFAWLSTNSIVAGCANGTLGVWNIATSITATPGTPIVDFAEPVIYAALATTYVLSVVSCSPSRPNIVVATTMAGHLYTIDLMDLSTNTTFSPAATIRSTRSRMGRSVLVWHDWSQMVLSADDNFTLVAYPLRRIFRQIGCTRYKSPVLAVAVSPVHPFVLAAGVGGEVTSTNPLRRAYESKVPIWNQIWFTHEWRALHSNGRTTYAVDEDTEMSSTQSNQAGQTTESARDARQGSQQGMSRILEGYKCQEIKLFNTEDSFAHREGGAIYTTVYELKTSVTTVCWNPNINVGGWSAAGMASGLLRVEDIAS